MTPNLNQLREQMANAGGTAMSCEDGESEPTILDILGWLAATIIMLALVIAEFAILAYFLTD